MNTVTEAAVLQALSAVRDPDFNRDIVDLKFVANLRIDGGRVSFTIELATPASSAKEADARPGARPRRPDPRRDVGRRRDDREREAGDLARDQQGRRSRA